MKKVFAIVMIAVLMFSLSATVLAYDSPVAAEKHKVVYVNGNDEPRRVTVDNQGDDAELLELKADADGFREWVFYKRDGSVAEDGVDYEFVSGSATTNEATVRIKTDLVVGANYENATIDVEKALPYFDDQYSPKTGDVVTASALLVLVAALGGIVVAKKRLAA